MATITSSGIGSGLDINGIISKLMDVERQPLIALQTKEASYQAKLSAFGSLQGAFASLQSAARGLKSYSLFSGMTATAADSSVLVSSANTAAKAASYAIDVVALAKGQTIVSQSAQADMTTDVITTGAGDGKLKIELGTVSGGVFTRDPARAAVTIDIPEAASSLGEIRDAINNAGAGVTARVVDVGNNQYKLMVSANGMGANTNIQITALDSAGNTPAPAGLDQFGYDPATKTGGFAETVAAQDAHIKINSLDVYRSTNTISDAITGVTLSLAKEGSTSLAVAKNTGAVSDALKAFVQAYNAANDQVRQLTAYDMKTQQASILFGDSGARALQAALGDMLGLSVPVITGSSTISRLSDLGITRQRDGSLQFNTAKFEGVLKSHPDAVEQIISTGNGQATGIASRMTSMLDDIMSERNGILASRTDGIGRSIAEIGKRRDTLLRRLVQIEQRYRKQFSALDTAMSNMQQTSQYLQQQFAALNNLNKN